MTSSLALRATLALLCVAAVCNAAFVLKHEAPQCIRDHADCSARGHDYRLAMASPAGLTHSPAEELLTLHFAVRQRNLEQLTATLMAVSDPRSPRYGRHLTRDQVQAAHTDFEAAARVVAYVTPFVNVNGSDGEEFVRDTGDFVSVRLTAAAAGRMLNTQFHTFRSARTGRSIHRAFAYSLPESIHALVDYVSAVTRFPPLQRPRFRVSSASGAGVPKTVTPPLINSVYGITHNIASNPAATQSVYESLGQDFSNLDLQQFFKTFGVPSQPIAKIIGPNDPNGCTADPNNCGESMLDVEYLMAIAQKSPTTYWSTPASEDFTQFLVDVSAAAHPPLVHSISYGEVESTDITDAGRFNTVAQTLGTRGVTIVVASGDDGVANYPARGNASACGFFPSFPASSPFVVAVGATQGPEAGQPEVACSSITGCGITTGGGFSTLFPVASWQSDLVAAYLNGSGAPIPPLSMFNSAGRAYPDVAALGINYQVVDGGKTVVESGTSASAPVFAAMLTLINSARLDAGKSALGFANPALYAAYAADPTCYTDITQGENNCAAGGDPCCPNGFTAAPGFDPLSGLGSVNFGQLLKVLVAM